VVAIEGYTEILGIIWIDRPAHRLLTMMPNNDRDRFTFGPGDWLDLSRIVHRIEFTLSRSGARSHSTGNATVWNLSEIMCPVGIG
jgi:hypothetical protein